MTWTAGPQALWIADSTPNGTLLTARDGGSQGLWRLTFEADGRIDGAQSVPLGPALRGIRAIAAGADDALCACTADTLVRLDVTPR